MAAARRAPQAKLQSSCCTAPWRRQLARPNPNCAANSQSGVSAASAASCVDAEAWAGLPGVVLRRSAVPIRLPPACTDTPPLAASALCNPSAASPASTDSRTVSAACGSTDTPGSSASSTCSRTTASARLSCPGRHGPAALEQPVAVRRTRPGSGSALNCTLKAGRGVLSSAAVAGNCGKPLDGQAHDHAPAVRRHAGCKARLCEPLSQRLGSWRPEAVSEAKKRSRKDRLAANATGSQRSLTGRA